MVIKILPTSVINIELAPCILTSPVVLYNKAHPNRNKLEDNALNIKYFNPASAPYGEFLLSVIWINNTKVCNSKAK